MNTVVENHVTGEKTVLKNQPPMPPVTSGLSMDQIIQAANAIANAPEDEVAERLKKAFKPSGKVRPKNPKPNPTPKPKAEQESEEQIQLWYIVAALRSHTQGRYEFAGQGLEDLKDVLAGTPGINFMSYNEWKAVRGYGKEKDAL